jgi:hypothetical protein
MQYYDLSYDCAQCREAHPMGVKLKLADGPKQRINLIAYTTDRAVPKAISEFIGSPVLCPNTGRTIKSNDMSRIYIQPI